MNSDTAREGLSGRLAAVMTLDAEAPAIEFDGVWRSWGALAATVDSVAQVVPARGAEVGVILRNRPVPVGLLLGVLCAGGCVVAINPGRGDERTRAEIAELGLAVIAGEPDDLDRLVPDDLRVTRVTAGDLGADVAVARCAESPEAVVRTGVAVRMLTSGTTGPPKRVDLTYRTLERVLLGAKHYESRQETTPRLRKGVVVVHSPMVHLGGLFRILMCVSDGRAASLLERFTVEGWVDAVRRHRPATSPLVPAALRMVLEAGPDPADLSSLRSIVCGTAPLDPDDADAFTARYGAPVLVTYAATEFGGSVAGWNLADYERHWERKRGSVGRAHPGCDLRIVDPVTGSSVGPDVEGLLEVRAEQIADQGWVRTTDLARIDGDGFLFIVGRADQAIIRGGYKVMPDDIRVTLERHPSVRGAAVVPRRDERLGEVPVVAVELRSDRPPAGVEELLTHAGAVLARYELPAEIRIVEELPRTDSGKVDLAAVRALFGDG